MFRLLEVSVPDKVGDGEEDEERSDVETPKEQPVDLVVEHLYLYLYLYLYLNLYLYLYLYLFVFVFICIYLYLYL